MFMGLGVIIIECVGLWSNYCMNGISNAMIALERKLGMRCDSSMCPRI